MYNILEMSKDILQNQKIIKERAVIDEFNEYLRLCDNKIVFTEKETVKLFDEGIIEKLIISENYKLELIEYLIENGKSVNTTIHIISDSTSEGTAFVKNFNGIGGILRYPIYDDADATTDNDSTTDNDATESEYNDADATESEYNESRDFDLNEE